MLLQVKTFTISILLFTQSFLNIPKDNFSNILPIIPSRILSTQIIPALAPLKTTMSEDSKSELLLQTYLSNLESNPPTPFEASLEPFTFISKNESELFANKEGQLENRLSKTETSYFNILKTSKPERNNFYENQQTKTFQYAREIEEKYGIEIDYGVDAMDYWRFAAHSTSGRASLSQIYQSLSIIDEELSLYPKGIFYTALRGINISLVSKYEDMGEKLKGEYIEGVAQVREENVELRNQYATYFMSLRVDGPDLRTCIHHELGHLLAFRINPDFTSGIYPEFSQLYDNLSGIFPTFLSDNANPLKATHITRYQAYDNHEYLSILYASIIKNSPQSTDFFPANSFLRKQAETFRDIILQHIPELAEFQQFVTFGYSDVTPPNEELLSKVKIDREKGLTSKITAFSYTDNKREDKSGKISEKIIEDIEDEAVNVLSETTSSRKRVIELYAKIDKIERMIEKFEKNKEQK